jgi:peptidoglycan/LPS O-acetylase OafA/YrhL
LALVMVVAGGWGSLVFMLHEGRHNNSVPLLLLFTAWVLSPFVLLLVANVVSKRWSVTSRLILYSLMFALTVGCLICYSGTVSSPWSKPAAAFLVVPLFSLLLIAIVFPIAKSKSQKQSRQNDNM